MQSVILGETVRSFTRAWKWHLNHCFWHTKSNHHIFNHPSRCLATTADQELSKVKDAQVVVCGGGISGVSVSYHLAKKGWRDVLLLEQGSLTCGTTWHAAGLVGLVKSDLDHRQLAWNSADLYESLEEETGLSTGFKRCGAIYLALTADRLEQLSRFASQARAEGLECHVLNPSQLQDIVPWISVEDVIGGIYSPQDCVTDPTNTVMSLARGAKMNGVKVVENVGLKRVLTTDGRVSGVETDKGQVIRCDYFVNAAGMWARNVGQMSSPPVTVPLQPNQHHYAVFKPKAGVNYNAPYVRDWDNGIYIREFSEGLLFGAFVDKGKPVFLDGKPPNSEFMSLQEDWEQIEPYFDSFLKRVPSGRTLELRQLFAGPESFTPDFKSSLGEVPEIKNYFVAAGFHSHGVTYGGGAGRYLADWIVNGKPTRHMASVDVKRFAPHHNQLQYLQDRASETEGKLLQLFPPYAEYKTGRKLCCTALYEDLSKLGAVFGEVIGIEQPLYFNSEGGKLCMKGSIWGKPPWFDEVMAEYQACMDSVGIADMSVMALFELQSNSNECQSMLQKLCSSNISAALGSFTNTWMLNDDGHIMNDCVVMCLDTNRYILMSPVRQWTYAKSWLTQHLPEDQSVTFKDLTPGGKEYQCGCYTILSVIGPKAERLLHRLTDDEHIQLSGDKNRCLPYGSHGHILTTTLTGYTGFLLVIPSQNAQAEYKNLMSTSKDLGMRNVGNYAVRWMQIENRIPSYVIDFDENNTPMEIALSTHCVDLQKDAEFLGQAALMKLNAEGTTQQLVLCTLEDFNVHTDLWPWGSEPIYCNGEAVGSTSCSAYSPSCGTMVCLGMIRSDERVSSSSAVRDVYQIDIGGKRHGMRPSNGRMNVKAELRI